MPPHPPPPIYKFTISISRHLCERNDEIFHQTPAQNEGIQIGEILAKADGGWPRVENYEVAYHGFVFGADGMPKERPNCYITAKLRLYYISAHIS